MAQLLFSDLLEQAEKKMGRSISNGEIAEATGLQSNTIGRLRRGFAVSFNGDTFDLIIAYLRDVLEDDTIGYGSLIREDVVELPNPPRIEVAS